MTVAAIPIESIVQAAALARQPWILGALMMMSLRLMDEKDLGDAASPR
jgi:hypothetical protein